jgi:hypothetical protein
LNASWPPCQTNADPGVRACARQTTSTIKNDTLNSTELLRHLGSNHEFAIVRWPNANIFGHPLSDEAGILASGQPARVMARAQS